MCRDTILFPTKSGATPFSSHAPESFVIDSHSTASRGEIRKTGETTGELASIRQLAACSDASPRAPSRSFCGRTKRNGDKFRCLGWRRYASLTDASRWNAERRGLPESQLGGVRSQDRGRQRSKRLVLVLIYPS